MPWHWYASSALPRAMTASLLLVPLGCVADERAVGLLSALLSAALGSPLLRPSANARWLHADACATAAVAAAFVALYSFLPHKELRFVFAAAALFNAVAARGARHLLRTAASLAACAHRAAAGPAVSPTAAPKRGAAADAVEGAGAERSGLRRRRKQPSARGSGADARDSSPPRPSQQRGGGRRRAKAAAFLLQGAVVGGLALTLGCSAVFAAAARHNYPGGEAMAALHALDVPCPLRVHVDPYAAMNGVTRFGEADGWRYSKNESLARPADFEGFDALLTENPRLHEGRFRTVHTAHVFAGFDWRAARVRTRPAVHVMLRRRSEAEWAARCEGSGTVGSPASHAAQQ